MNAMVEENHQNRNPNLISKSGDSSIKIDSISIDLINVNEKISTANCEHFSIRGYVSDIRKKDWKMCWPFDSNKHDDEACKLPSLHVPKFRYWRCQSCLCDFGAENGVNDYDPIQKSCSGGLKSNGICSHASILDDVGMLVSDFHQAPKLGILEKKRLGANASANLNCTTGFLSSSCNDLDKQKNGIANGSSLGDMESHDNLDKEMHLLTTENSSLMQKNYRAGDIDLRSKSDGCIDSKKGCRHHEAADAELSGKINRVVKIAPKKHETGKVFSVGDQCKELTVFGMSGEAGVIEEVRSVEKSEGGHPYPELDECDYASSESAEIMVRNNRRGLHCDASSGPHRRKTRKVRLLTELLSEKDDVDADNIRNDAVPSNCIPDTSVAGDKLPVPQGQVAIQGNIKRGLGQHRKRKLDQDEEWKPLESNSPIKACKEVRITKRDVETTDAIEKAFAKMHLQNNMKKHCNKRRIDGSPCTSKRKNKKTLMFDDSSTLDPKEKVSYEIVNRTDDASEGVLLKDAHNTVPGRELDFFALSAQRNDRKSSLKKRSKMPQVDEQQVALATQTHSMLRKDVINRKDVKLLHAGPVMVPFHSAQDTSCEERLNLSLNSFLTTERYDTQKNAQVEDGRVSILTVQDGKEDHVHRKAPETKYVENFIFAPKSVPFSKGAYIDMGGRRSACSIPFLNERQNYVSHVETGSCSHMQQKIYSTSSNFNKIGIQEHSAVMRKESDYRSKVAEQQGASDDIPMEIVELMAKHQYERCLPDADYDRCQLDNSKSGRTMGFNKVYGKGEMNLFMKETAKNERNGILKKQKSVDYFSHTDLTQLHIQQAPPFFQHQDKPPTGPQHSSSSSGRQSSAQSYKWMGDVANRSLHNCMQSSGTCNTCQHIAPQSKETTQLWPSMIPNHIPFVYNVPQKCNPMTTNIDVLLNSPSNVHKENTNGSRDLQFLTQNAGNFGKQSRNFCSETPKRCGAEYPFACKHNAIELNQKPVGSLDLYSNETIPAMHLLSLMDAGLRSSVPVNLDVTPKFFKRPPVAHDQDPKDLSRMDSGAFKANNTLKPTSYDCHGKSQLRDNSCGRISSISTTVVGPPASSFQHEKCFKKAIEFTPQEKLKVKESDLHTQNKGCRLLKSPCPSGNFGSNCGSVPVHSMQTMLFNASDSMAFPIQFRRLENSAKNKLEAPGGTQYVQPHRSSLETGSCSLNRNPAEFSVPEAGNIYTIAGEDLKFGKGVPFSNGPRSARLGGQKRQKKVPVVKEHRRQLIS